MLVLLFEKKSGRRLTLPGEILEGSTPFPPFPPFPTLKPAHFPTLHPPRPYLSVMSPTLCLPNDNYWGTYINAASQWQYCSSLRNILTIINNNVRLRRCRHLRSQISSNTNGAMLGYTRREYASRQASCDGQSFIRPLSRKISNNRKTAQNHKLYENMPD